MQNRPALKFCIPFILGIILGWEIALPFWPAVAAGSAALVLAIATRRRVPLIQPLLLFLMLFCLGILKITFDARPMGDDRIENFIAHPKRVILSGTIAELPSRTIRSVRFVIDAETLTVDGVRRRAEGGVLVSLWNDRVDDALLDSLTYGRRFSVAGELTPPGTARNPGEFDLRHYLHLNNIGARLFADSLDPAALGPEAEESFLAGAVFPVRKSVAARIDRSIGGEEAKFLKGLLIGERSDIPAEVKTSFINAGVMHIIAVSGLHVAIVTLILFFLLQIARVPEKPRILLTAAILVYYIYLTGAAPSVARSVIMAIVFLAARLIERRSDILNTLAVSALILLLADAKQLFQPGFQLSFAAVWSLVTIYPRISAWRKFLPRWMRERRLPSAVIAGAAVSIAAGIGTLPFTSLYFGKISVVSFLANIVIVPLSNVILGLGMLTVGLDYVWGWAAGIYAGLTIFLTWLLLKAVDAFGAAPFAYVDSHFTILTSLLFYAGVWCVFQLHRRLFRKRLLIAVLAAADLWLVVTAVQSPQRKTIRVAFIDVGQGDAVLITFPDERVLLIDAGPKTFSSDAGSRFIAPYLSYSGISRLNGIVVTHPHSDHLGGIPYLLRHCRIDRVMDAGSESGSFLTREYLHCIDSLGIPRTILRAGMVIADFPDVRLFVLHPTDRFLHRGKGGNASFNNQSVVIKLCYGRTSLLLPGDIERDAEERLVRSYGPFLAADLLKLGHHGGSTSSAPEFSSAVHPREAVISVGANNKFGHPSPSVLRTFAVANCPWARTDESGAIIYESDGTEWRRIEWR